MNGHINPSWEFGYINPPHIHKISGQTNDLKCLSKEISKTKILLVESNITSLLNSMTEPENKKYSSQSLNLTSTKPVKDTKVTTTCVGASVVKKTKTNVKTNLVDEPHTKKSKKSKTVIFIKVLI